MVSETGADQRKFTLFDGKKSIYSDTLFSDGDEVYHPASG